MTFPARIADDGDVAVSFAESLVGADPETDAERERNLRKMKAVALGFRWGFLR